MKNGWRLSLPQVMGHQLPMNLPTQKKSHLVNLSTNLEKRFF